MEAVADFPERERCNNAFNNGISNIFMNQEAGAGHAILTLEEERRATNTGNDFFHVRVREHYNRGLAAQLKGYFFQVAAGRCFGDSLANAG